MSIITKAEVKQLLQIPDNTKDMVIDALIPVIQDFVCQYCNNYFEVVKQPNYDIIHKTNSTKTYYTNSYSISFHSGTPAKILDSRSQNVLIGFLPGAHVIVRGSILNDGIYKVTTVTPGELRIEEPLIDEPSGNNLVTLSAVVFPPGLKLPVAKLIAYELNKDVNRGLNSQSLGDYSANISTSYPPALLSALNVYRRPVSI